MFVWALEQKDSRRGWDRGDEQDVLVPWVLKQNHAKSPAKANLKNECPSKNTCLNLPTTYRRYYHLYREGELQHDVITAGGKVVREGYDRDNWWVVFMRAD